MIAAVDSLEVQILVDNTTDMLSSTPEGVESESAGLFRRGGRMTAGRCFCCAAHGLSCLLTAQRGTQRHTLLFDTGPEEYAFERNTSRLGCDLSATNAIVLSHGHWDHAGALLLALQMIRSRQSGETIPFYGHPEMFATRAVRMPNGELRMMDNIPTPAQLQAHGADVILSKNTLSVLSNTFLISGEIPRRTEFERGYPGQVRLNQNNGQWEDDALLMDERWVGVNVKNKGLVIFSACSHAGIVNVLHHCRELFPSMPIYAVFGGFHLSGVNEALIPQTVAGLREFSPKLIGAGHCTGWRAISALSRVFDDQVLAPTAVGKRYLVNAN
jgi:7,8-dihydropterin-6-yl-methyl-4-(beta-D-ribofuranosyl)aminobenzene 5'-phosphate synthase